MKIQNFLSVGIISIVVTACSSSLPKPTEAVQLPLDPSNFLEPAPLKPGTLYAPVLMYHNVAQWDKPNPYVVSPEIFEQQMRWLKEHEYTVVRYEDFYHAFAGKKELPKKPVVITFDDGDLNQYENAFPILKKYGYTAIFFVSTKVIDGRNALTWDMLKELRDAGMEIGSHTMTHRDLTKLSREEVRSDLVGSKYILEKNLDMPIEFLAYPGGGYNEEVVEETLRAGYASAVGVRKGVFHSKKDESFYSMKRVHVHNNLEEFPSCVRGEKVC